MPFGREILLRSMKCAAAHRIYFISLDSSESNFTMPERHYFTRRRCISLKPYDFKTACSMHQSEVYIIQPLRFPNCTFYARISIFSKRCNRLFPLYSAVPPKIHYDDFPWTFCWFIRTNTRHCSTQTARCSSVRVRKIRSNSSSCQDAA